VDGDFGPSTRAAVKLYQQSIGEEGNGRLTPGQAMRLLASAAQAAPQP
jgi:peptidoglycan hydrolase-like protein with peptidoglycan-binding domain